MTTILTIACWEFSDTITLGATIIVAILPYALIQFLKPKLEIESARIECEKTKKTKKGRTKYSNVIKVRVANKRNISDANNVRIEMCAIDKCNFTYHLVPDFESFLIIPAKKTRNFKSYKILKSTQKNYGVEFEDILKGLKKGKYSLRVRVHSYHSFSGFGRSEEKVIDCL